MTSHHIEAEVLVNGKRVAHHKHDGRHFIEGREGTEYSLRLKNDNGYRVKVSVGVDGINVVDSKPLGIGAEEAGYLINAHDSLTIKGYRVSNDEVAAFKFTKADQAYALKDKGLSGTTGVITVRAFAEKEKPVPAPSPVVIREDHHHYHDSGWPFRTPWTTTWCSTSESKRGAAYGGPLRATAMSRSADAVQSCASTDSMQFSASLDSAPETPFSLGSSWGAKTESRVREVAFEVGAFLTQIDVFYTTREGLKALGVDISRTSAVVFPDATPGRYCTPPSGWKENADRMRVWCQSQFAE